MIDIEYKNFFKLWEKEKKAIDENKIETRPIISGNFMNQPSIKLYKLNEKIFFFNTFLNFFRSNYNFFLYNITFYQINQL